MPFIASRIQALATADDLPARLAQCAGGEGSERAVRQEIVAATGVRPAFGSSLTHCTAGGSAAVVISPRGTLASAPYGTAGLARPPWRTDQSAGRSGRGGRNVARGRVREFGEELGAGTDVDLLGQLADCYVFASDFLVTPWVAAAEFEPQWRPDVREVRGVVEMPLDVLLDASAIGRLSIERGPLTFHAPCISLGDTRVWGATSIILSELADVLRTIAEEEE